MTTPTCRVYQPGDRASLVGLWERCGLTHPANDPDRDIVRKLAVAPDLLLVLDDGGELVGSVMAGYEGHRGWINYLAVDPDHRGRGWGRRLMVEAELRLGRLGCPKVNLQVRTSNPAAVGFYRQLGYEVDDVVSMGRRLVDDSPPPDA